MKRYATILLLFLTITSSAIAQVKHTVVKSSVSFKIKNLGFNVSGSFGGFKSEINFDPAHLDASTIEASIQVNTISTGNETRDHHLKGDGYFNAEKYPSISMKSVSFKHNSGNSYTGTFNLTIKDKTNKVNVPFTYSESGNSASFKGSLKIKRTDYGVGGGSLIMSSEVNLAIEVTTSK